MDTSDIAFTSFGLVVLDEIRIPNQKPLTNILGGSGAHGPYYITQRVIFTNIRAAATLGARLFLAPPLSRNIAWPIHVGNDFPDAIADLLQSWEITLALKREMNQLSTRGLLQYKDTTFGRMLVLLSSYL